MSIKTDPRIDAYIKRAAPFAQPILKHLRALIHRTCPDVQETMKWSFPHFDYKGQVMCSMAAFKQHAVFGFWKEELLRGQVKLFANTPAGKTAMGSLGRITSLQDLPKDNLLQQAIRAAMKLNDAGIKVPRAKPIKKTTLRTPSFLLTALKQHPRAYATWQQLRYSHKKEYIEWITQAKTDTTRDKRLATTIEWLINGKSRNWKYER